MMAWEKISPTKLAHADAKVAELMDALDKLEGSATNHRERQRIHGFYKDLYPLAEFLEKVAKLKGLDT